jgi:anti-sigma regulatory factor (Ser/Thr protein kinase)
MTTLPRVRTYPADAPSIAELREFVRSRAVEAGLNQAATDDLLVAVTEACTELLSHEKASELIVSWWDLEGAIEIRLKEEGLVPSPAAPASSRLTVVEDDAEFGSGGMGFPYIMAYVDEYTVELGTAEDPSTTIRLVKETAPAPV